MAGPITPIIYNFNGVDANPDPNFTALLNAIQRVSNQGAGTNAATNIAYLTGVTHGANCEEYITIGTKPGTGNSVALIARAITTSLLALSGYEWVFTDAAGTDTMQMFRLDNAVGTQLGSTVNQEWAAGDGLFIKPTGTTLEGYWNNAGTWTLKLTTTDATYASGGNVVLAVLGTTGRVDDLGGGTAVNLAGTSPITFGQSGALSDTDPLAGSSSITFGQSGALSDVLGLAGSSSIAFSQSGALSDTVNLVGASSILFGQTGDLTQVNPLAGASNITFGQSANLTDTLGLAGNSAVVFGQSGDLTDTKPLAGTSAIVFGGTADLTAGGGYFGNSTITFGQSSALSDVSNLAGSSPILFGQTANLSLAHALAGLSTIVFGGQGTLYAPTIDIPETDWYRTSSLPIEQNRNLIAINLNDTSLVVNQRDSTLPIEQNNPRNGVNSH